MGTDKIYISLKDSPSFQRLNESSFNTGNVNTTLTSEDDLLLNSELTIQEQVVIGALVTVAFLSLFAIVLRVCMPMFRRTKHNVIQTECKYTEQVICKEKRYGQLPYKVSSSSNASSQSSSWSSNSQLDWSDSSSNKTRSTYYTSESKNMSSLPSSYSNFRGSTSSLPLSFTDDRSNRSNASSFLKYINEDPVYILNKKSLDTLTLDDAYRSRWDEEFDPLQVTPSGSLASLSHPSEDRTLPDRIPNFYEHKRIPQKVHNPLNVGPNARQNQNHEHKGNRSLPTQSCRM